MYFSEMSFRSRFDVLKTYISVQFDDRGGSNLVEVKASNSNSCVKYEFEINQDISIDQHYLCFAIQ